MTSTRSGQKVGVTFKKLWQGLTSRRRQQLVLFSVLVLFAAIAEMISIGAIIPFLSVIASPETLFRLDSVVWFSNRLGFDEPGQLRFPLTLAFCCAIIVASGLRLLLLWVNSKLAYLITHDLSVEVYRRSLYLPYSVQIARNSSKLLGALVKTKSITVSLNALLQMGSGICISTLIIVALLLVDPMIALVSFCGFGAVYVLTTVLTRKRLSREGKVIAEMQTARFRALQDGMGGMRDVLLDGNQPLYTRLFQKVDRPLNTAQASTTFLSNSPRHIIEPIGVVLIVILTYILSGNTGGFATTVPTLGALALGAQRLLPVLQQIYAGWATLSSHLASLDDVVEFLDEEPASEHIAERPAPLDFRNEIRFSDVWFRYHEDGPDVLRGIDIAIPRGSRIGFLGTTGSGKSTLFDLLMGLLSPTQGSILVDGKALSGRDRLAWQGTIAHVPQAIYLADATFAENIAFGVPSGAIDMERVRAAAKQAQIADFIERQAKGYMAEVGERGVRISGGQRQRIGIARALYKKAGVLIFDEATSALDNETERSVIEAIEGLDKSLTICMIAHRLTTLRNCDTVVKMEDGRIVGKGSYSEILGKGEGRVTQPVE